MALRNEVLDAAHEAVYADRAPTYGHPADNFQRTAHFWNVYLDGRSYIAPEDVAILMMLNKIARLMETPDHLDSVIDIAGYAETYGLAIAAWKASEKPLRNNPCELIGLDE